MENNKHIMQKYNNVATPKCNSPVVTSRKLELFQKKTLLTTCAIYEFISESISTSWAIFLWSNEKDAKLPNRQSDEVSP